MADQTCATQNIDLSFSTLAALCQQQFECRWELPPSANIKRHLHCTNCCRHLFESQEKKISLFILLLAVLHHVCKRNTQGDLRVSATFAAGQYLSLLSLHSRKRLNSRMQCVCGVSGWKIHDRISSFFKNPVISEWLRYLQLISEANVEVRLTCILFNGHQGVISISVVSRALPVLYKDSVKMILRHNLFQVILNKIVNFGLSMWKRCGFSGHAHWLTTCDCVWVLLLLH